MKILDLFSCIGCHALGMQRAGHKVVQLCENNPWRQTVLRRNFPRISLHEDVKTLTHTHKADVCFGGPPCQATSVASAIHGRRTNASLWFHMLKAGQLAGCQWFIVEQPPGNAAWEDEVCTSLCSAGYHVAIFEFSAADVGAPYLRRRRYITASTSLPRLALARQSLPQAIDRAKRAAATRGDWNPRAIPTVRMDTWRAEEPYERKQRIEALGDSNPPAMAEVIGWMLRPKEVPTNS